MKPKKSKYVTKQEVTKTVERLMLKYFTKGLSNQLTMLKDMYDRDMKGLNDKLDAAQAETKDLRRHLVTLAIEGLANAYALDRITKNDVVESLKELHNNDMLAVTEQLEEIDQMRDDVIAYLKREVK